MNGLSALQVPYSDPLVRHGTMVRLLGQPTRVNGWTPVQMPQENGVGEVESPGGKRKGPPLTEEERRVRRKEINRESARRIRRRKNNEMDSLKQQARPGLFTSVLTFVSLHRVMTGQRWHCNATNRWTVDLSGCRRCVCGSLWHHASRCRDPTTLWL